MRGAMRTAGARDANGGTGPLSLLLAVVLGFQASGCSAVPVVAGDGWTVEKATQAVLRMEKERMESVRDSGQGGGIICGKGMGRIRYGQPQYSSVTAVVAEDSMRAMGEGFSLACTPEEFTDFQYTGSDTIVRPLPPPDAWNYVGAVVLDIVLFPAFLLAMSKGGDVGGFYWPSSHPQEAEYRLHFSTRRIAFAEIEKVLTGKGLSVIRLEMKEGKPIVVWDNGNSFFDGHGEYAEAIEFLRGRAAGEAGGPQAWRATGAPLDPWRPLPAVGSPLPWRSSRWPSTSWTRPGR